MNGIGAHEVIVETPEHTQALLRSVGGGHRRRARRLSRPHDRPDARQPLQVRHDLQEPRRRGRRVARAPHSQLIALPVVPTRRLRGDEGRARALRAQGALRLLRHRAAGAQGARARWSTRTPASWSCEPYAPKFPFETWILPRAPSRTLRELAERGFALLANALQGGASQAERGARRPAVQLHPAHHAVRRARPGALPLAHRDHADA